MNKFSLEFLIAYLKINHWHFTDFDEYFFKIEKTINDEYFRLKVPKTEELYDYDYFIEKLIIAFSIIEGKKKEVVLDEVNNYGYDIIKFRLVSPRTENGTFPLSDFPRIVENIKKIIKFSACSEIKEELSFGRPLGLSEALVDECQIGQTEVGSFVVNVKVPTRDFDEKEKYGEKVLSRIMTGFNEAKTINIEEDYHYNKKLNKNVFDSVIDMMGNRDDTFDVEIKASGRNCNLNYSSDFQRFKSISAKLKRISNDIDVVVRGTVQNLHHKRVGEEDIREIIVQDLISRGKVKISLDEESYNLACDVNKDMKIIRVDGVLRREKGKLKVLNNPTNFRIDDNQDVNINVN